MANLYDIILFHYPCQDGLVSAWVADYYHRQNDKKLELYPIYHGGDIDMEKLRGKSVICCDYAPSLEELEKMEKIVTKITILDHHISAQRDLENKSYAIFDMNLSGAGLTWKYFYGDNPPDFVSMIQDRDLWTWKLPKTRDFTSGLSTICSTLRANNFEKLFELFDELLTDSTKYLKYLEIGKIVGQVNINKAMEIADAHYKTIDQYNDYKVCIVNCPGDLVSDVGSSLVSRKDRCDFAVLWNYYHPTKEYKISLRSGNRADVSVIAKQFGGGGHRNAAGFTSTVSPMILFM